MRQLSRKTSRGTRGSGIVSLPSMSAALVSSMGMVDLKGRRRNGGVLRRDRHVDTEGGKGRKGRVSKVRPAATRASFSMCGKLLHRMSSSIPSRCMSDVGNLPVTRLALQDSNRLTAFPIHQHMGYSDLVVNREMSGGAYPPLFHQLVHAVYHVYAYLPLGTQIMQLQARQPPNGPVLFPSL